MKNYNFNMGCIFQASSINFAILLVFTIKTKVLFKIQKGKKAFHKPNKRESYTTLG